MLVYWLSEWYNKINNCILMYLSHLLHIHLVVCLTTIPNPLPKPALHIVRSRASSFKWEYPLLSLRSSNSFLRLLLPRLPVTSIPPFIFPSITRCRRQFLRKMWPIQLVFLFLISCRIFLCSLTLGNSSSLNVFLTVHHELTIYWLPTWCTDYYLFVKYYSSLHVSSIKCSSSGGHTRSCIQAAYGTVTLYKSPGGLLIRSYREFSL